MYFKETIYDKNGEIVDACLFKFTVDLDGVEKINNARLILKPLDPCVVVARRYFKDNESNADPYNYEIIKEFYVDAFYDDEDDEINLNIIGGFDVAIFNICSLLGIGRLHLDDAVKYSCVGFAPIHDKVSSIKLTLEEFKMLDGFVACLKFTDNFVLFKGLVIGANYIHEDVHDGDVVPKFNSDKLLRGENLFLLD